MITPDYARQMASYNEWQNQQLRDVMRSVNEDVLRQERGAFFGSILETANHVLWADQLWLSRLSGFPPPTGALATSKEATSSLSEWEIARFRTDKALSLWARDLRSIDLTGPLTWHSEVRGAPLTKPLSLCVMHMFNHQTHHRGQIHVMLTAVGCTGPQSDLIFMEETIDSLCE